MKIRRYVTCSECGSMLLEKNYDTHLRLKCVKTKKISVQGDQYLSCPICGDTVTRRRYNAHLKSKCLVTKKRTLLSYQRERLSERKVKLKQDQNSSPVYSVPVNPRYADRVVGFIGNNPYNVLELAKLVPPGTACLTDFSRYHLSNTFVKDIQIMVVGRYDFSRDLIKRYVFSKGAAAKVIPQEGFMAELFLHQNWWNTNSDCLGEALESHKGLQYARSLFLQKSFKWPSTDVSTPPCESESEIDYKETTPLFDLGYTVNAQVNLTPQQRWDVLIKAVQTLGLREVAYTIANHCISRKRQRNRDRYKEAISKWEYDLDQLKRNFYDRGTKGFHWPRID